MYIVGLLVTSFVLRFATLHVFNQLYFEESMICVNYLYKLGLVIKT